MKLLKNLFIGDYKSFSDEKSYKVFFVTNLFLLLGIPIHIFYISIFICLNTYPMIIVELLSIVTLTMAVYINRKKVKYIPALMMCIEIGTNGVLWATILKSGYNHYLYTFVALLAVFLFLELKKYQKVFVTIFLFICLNISHSAEVSYISFITYKNKNWLALFTLNMVFFILTLELTINEITNEAIKSMYKKTVQKMESEIMLDPLTKAYNRRYFQENEKIFDENSNRLDCCAAILDIDHFKAVNDTYGHDIGDKVLIFFVDQMKNEFRSSDIIIRWGGEEFVILLNNSNLKTSAKKLDDFRVLIQNSKINIEDKTIGFTFTAGVCKIGHGINTSEAIIQADKYLYFGKTSGRNQVVYQ